MILQTGLVKLVQTLDCEREWPVARIRRHVETSVVLGLIGKMDDVRFGLCELFWRSDPREFYVTSSPHGDYCLVTTYVDDGVVVTFSRHRTREYVLGQLELFAIAPQPVPGTRRLRVTGP